MTTNGHPATLPSAITVVGDLESLGDGALRTPIEIRYRRRDPNAESSIVVASIATLVCVAMAAMAVEINAIFAGVLLLFAALCAGAVVHSVRTAVVLARMTVANGLLVVRDSSRGARAEVSIPLAQVARVWASAPEHDPNTPPSESGTRSTLFVELPTADAVALVSDVPEPEVAAFFVDVIERART